MKIAQSTLQSQSAALSWEHTHHETNLRIAVRSPQFNRPQVEASTRVSLSNAATAQAKATDGSSANGSHDIRLQVLISVIEMLTGHKVQIFDAGQLAATQSDAAAVDTPAAASPETGSNPDVQVHFETRDVHEEAEVAQYSAKGSVTTADGRSISFSLDLSMQRYERQESSLTVDVGTPRTKDPLVLNLNAQSASLSSDTFSFDLNGDGSAENLAKLGSGSFFLALDRNGNGNIDSGKELFGAQSGDGFTDLAALDQDHNGWIDESDAAYSQLRLWRPGEGMQSLADAGVGAIALDHRATPFTLKNENGETAGAVRTTGLYLSENGQAGSLQQIDLVV